MHSMVDGVNDQWDDRQPKQGWSPLLHQRRSRAALQAQLREVNDSVDGESWNRNACLQPHAASVNPIAVPQLSIVAYQTLPDERVQHCRNGTRMDVGLRLGFVIVGLLAFVVCVYKDVTDRNDV